MPERMSDAELEVDWNMIISTISGTEDVVADHKRAREAEKKWEKAYLQVQVDMGLVIFKLRTENAEMKDEIEKCKQSAYYRR